MPGVKICGVTRLADALAAAEAGAAAIGFNFWPGGPRYIAPAEAAAIATALPDGVLRVGVFVDARAADILDIKRQVGLDIVQLHGDEGPAYPDAVPGPVWKAFRGQVTPSQLSAFGSCAAFVLDGARAGFYGGSGALADAASAARVKAAGRLVLAGGLTPKNVASRIREIGPDMVDVASGVESAPGIKDAVKIRAFLRAVRRASAKPLLSKS